MDVIAIVDVVAGNNNNKKIKYLWCDICQYVVIIMLSFHHFHLLLFGFSG